MPLRRALQMIDPRSGAIELNPHFFNYPSLSIYLHLAGSEIVYAIGRVLGAWRSPADFLLAFQIDPTPVVIVARLIHVAAELATVAAVFAIGRRVSKPCAVLAALLVALSPVLIRTQNTIIVDTLVATLLAWSLERLLAWDASRRMRDLLASAALAGLAASTKYPAALFLVPMLLVVALRARGQFVRLAPVVLAIASAAFVLTSPFVILDAAHALRDIAYEREHLAIGHLGGQGGGRLLRNLAPLGSFGPLGLVLLVISPLAWRRATNRSLVVAALGGFVVLVAPYSSIHVDAERYLAPAVPMAAVLVAVAGTWLAAQMQPRFKMLARGGVIIATLAPVALGGVQAAAGGVDDTQVLALEWCQRHVPANSLIVEEAWSAPLVTNVWKSDMAETPMYRLAAADARARFDQIRSYNVVTLPMWVTGTMGLPSGRRMEMIDLNRVCYQPALFAAADYVITSSAVRGRYASDTRRFHVQEAFYALLDRSAECVRVFSSSAAVSGPTIRVYRLTPRLRALLGQRPLSPSWWVPEPGAAGRPSTALARHELATWKPLYDAYFWRFAEEMAYAARVRGDTSTAEGFAAAW